MLNENPIHIKTCDVGISPDALLKEKLRLEKLLGDIEMLERKVQSGECLQRLQYAKLEKKAIAEQRLGDVRLQLNALVLPSLTPPRGLSVASIPVEIANAALEELSPCFRREGTYSKGSQVLEIGLLYYESSEGERGEEKMQISQMPAMCQLIRAATSIFNHEQLGDTIGLNCVDRLNIICRHFAPGQSLGLHVDAVDLFEEDVYGCVLQNTSDSALYFRHAASGSVYILNECSGFCSRQRGEARYEWFHGIDPLTKGERISVTWRWFRKGDDLAQKSRACPLGE